MIVEKEEGKMNRRFGEKFASRANDESSSHFVSLIFIEERQ
ncbi:MULTISPECIES: hypothetical protein [unclassified Sporosarcina]|nr:MULTISPECIES: hypothetical protein [unclassified Sporosarcina]